jgi:hypothetical protein
MELTAGRNFTQDILSDKTEAFIINQKAADQIGLENPVGIIHNFHSNFLLHDG